MSLLLYLFILLYHIPIHTLILNPQFLVNPFTPKVLNFNHFIDLPMYFLSILQIFYQTFDLYLNLLPNPLQ